MNCLSFGLLAAFTILQAPDAPPVSAPEAAVRILGEVPTPITLNVGALERLPRQVVRTRDHGVEAEFEGAPLIDVLKAAGVKFGEDLRGPALASYLVVDASDGYRAVFALPELDPASTDDVVILAYRRDGKPLNATEGPLRIVAPGEKRHSRWVRQVVSLKVAKS